MKKCPYNKHVVKFNGGNPKCIKCDLYLAQIKLQKPIDKENKVAKINLNKGLDKFLE